MNPSWGIALMTAAMTTAPGEAPSEPTVWRPLPVVAPAPADNPTTAAKVALGRRLFHDRNLSRDRSLSCASCHDVTSGAGTDDRATSLGIGGQSGARNAPTVWNAAFQARLFWDGRAASLEAQAFGPLVNPIEMGMPSHAAVETRVAEQPAYPPAFRAAFGGDGRITMARIAAAIAAYERTLITPDTPYDRFVRGDRRAMTSQQLRGMALFESVGCVYCHAGPNFSGASLFGAAAPYRGFPTLPTGRDVEARLREDPGRAPEGSPRGVWRIPSLRNVALTPPYFHNGAVERLDEAVQIMAETQLGFQVERAGHALPAPQVIERPGDAGPRLAPPRILRREEVQALVAFLEALSDDTLARRVEDQRRSHQTKSASNASPTSRTPSAGSTSSSRQRWK